MGFGGVLWCSWRALGRSWGAVGALLAFLIALGALLARSWGALGRSWSVLETLLGRSWALLEHSWALLGRSWLVLSGLERVLGASWKYLRRFVGHLGGICIGRLVLAIFAIIFSCVFKDCHHLRKRRDVRSTQ